MRRRPRRTRQARPRARPRPRAQGRRRRAMLEGAIACSYPHAVPSKASRRRFCDIAIWLQKPDDPAPPVLEGRAGSWLLGCRFRGSVGCLTKCLTHGSISLLLRTPVAPTRHSAIDDEIVAINEA